MTNSVDDLGPNRNSMNLWFIPFSSSRFTWQRKKHISDTLYVGPFTSGSTTDSSSDLIGGLIGELQSLLTTRICTWSSSSLSRSSWSWIWLFTWLLARLKSFESLNSVLRSVLRSVVRSLLRLIPKSASDLSIIDQLDANLFRFIAERWFQWTDRVKVDWIWKFENLKT